jgi:hypothetical protein
LTTLPGGPCTLVLCHPTKRAADDDLLPRGGGAFIAELDGNVAVYKKDSLLAVAPFGKFGGDNSWTMNCKLELIRDHPKLKDPRGQFTTSVVALPVGDGAVAIMEKRIDHDMEIVSMPSKTPQAPCRLTWHACSNGPSVRKASPTLIA